MNTIKKNSPLQDTILRTSITFLTKKVGGKAEKIGHKDTIIYRVEGHNRNFLVKPVFNARNVND